MSNLSGCRLVLAEGETRKPRWVYSVFPISLATGPLGTLVTLYLIQANGIALGTIYSGLAAAIYNGVSIPAAIFWGFLTDTLHKRRPLIFASNALVGAALISFYVDTTTAGAIARYSTISFVSVASATPLNLLIMETEPKGRWATAFARLSMLSSVGNVFGLLLGTFWTDALPSSLTLLFVPLGVFALASALIVLVTISEPSFVLERKTVAMRKPSFLSRLMINPVFILGLPRASDFRRVFRGLKSSLTSYLPLFYISTSLFYFSSGLFNTSFVPAMQNSSLSDQEVFGVILAGMVVQTVAFQYAGKFTSERPLATSSAQGLLLRGWCYIAIGASLVLIAGRLFVVPAVILYPLAAGVAFALYYTSSNTMMFNTVHGANAGSSLGVYSAVVGVATMGGSLASGFVSVYLGFYVTFILAGVLLFGAVWALMRLPKSATPQGGPHQ